MPAQAFTITLTGLLPREQEHAASELVRAIKQTDPSVTVERHPASATTMDFGASLAVILGSGAGIALAKGLQMWMGRWKNAELNLSSNGRTVVVKGLSGRDAIRVIEAFLSSLNAEK